MFFKSLDFIGNACDGYLYKALDKTWHLQKYVGNNFLYLDNYLNPSQPCTYEYTDQIHEINGQFYSQDSITYFNPLSVNSIYVSQHNYGNNYLTNYHIAFPQSNGEYTKTNTCLNFNFNDDSFIDSTRERQYFSIATKGNFGSNKNLYHGSIVKNDKIKNIFSLGTSRNIISLQKATGKSYIELMDQTLTPNYNSYRTTKTIISDDILINDSDKLYGFFSNKDSGEGTLYVAGDYNYQYSINLKTHR